MDIIQLSNSAATHLAIETLIVNIVTKVKNIPNVAVLKYDIELCKYICLIIENEVKNDPNQPKVDKLDIFIRVYTTVFKTLSDDEKTTLSNNIKFLLSNKLITEISTARKVASSTWAYFKKKLA